MMITVQGQDDAHVNLFNTCLSDLLMGGPKTDGIIFDIEVVNIQFQA